MNERAGRAGPQRAPPSGLCGGLGAPTAGRGLGRATCVRECALRARCASAHAPAWARRSVRVRPTQRLPYCSPCCCHSARERHAVLSLALYACAPPATEASRLRALLWRELLSFAESGTVHAGLGAPGLGQTPLGSWGVGGWADPWTLMGNSRGP